MLLSVATLYINFLFATQQKCVSSHLGQKLKPSKMTLKILLNRETQDPMVLSCASTLSPEGGLSIWQKQETQDVSKSPIIKMTFLFFKPMRFVLFLLNSVI